MRYYTLFFSIFELRFDFESRIDIMINGCTISLTYQIQLEKYTELLFYKKVLHKIEIRYILNLVLRDSNKRTSANTEVI